MISLAAVRFGSESDNQVVLVKSEKESQLPLNPL
jgi:hypothetical protein